MDEKTIKPKITGIKQEKTGKPKKDTKFKKGQSGNPKGRPVESLNFKTKWLIFIDKIAKQNGISVDEVDSQMLTVAYKQMQKGDYRYWKDIQDRVYGQATQRTESESIVNIKVELTTEQKKKLDSLLG